jgi:hypothetical protein
MGVSQSNCSNMNNVQQTSYLDNVQYCHKIDNTNVIPNDGITTCKYDTSTDIINNETIKIGINHRCPNRLNEIWNDSSNDTVSYSGLGCIKL